MKYDSLFKILNSPVENLTDRKQISKLGFSESHQHLGSPRLSEIEGCLVCASQSKSVRARCLVLFRKDDLPLVHRSFFLDLERCI